jgi:hypothetical protein
MSILIGILAAALLFAVFGLMRRGREPERCSHCPGHCGTCLYPDVEPPHVSPTDS